MPRREIYNAGNKDSLPGSLGRSEGDDPSTDELVNCAYDALGTTFDFFRTAYGRNSLDGQGGSLRATVHYRENFMNVFREKGRLVLGDGDGKIFQPRPRDLLDVFASLVKQYSLGQSAEQAD
ncbi:gluzincin family metallopeptidase [Kitasatospora griseola]|uniref:hypothetical protein n=1 Tax=Kitasatospora griseola TaxID=2064 RepID=UPI0036694D81